MKKKPKTNDSDELFKKQIVMLRTFLAHGAITEAQYRHSTEKLARKMGEALTDSFPEAITDR